MFGQDEGDDFVPAQPAPALPAEQAKWYDAWGQLKQIIAQLDDAVAKLQASRAFALARPNLAAEYMAKMADVESMKAKAVWLRDTIRSVMSAVGVELSGLGFAPAILVWPAVIAGVAWLGSKALDLWKFAQTVDEQRRQEQQLIAAGVSPAQAMSQAASNVKQTREAGTFGATLEKFGTVIVLGIVAAAVVFFVTRRKSQRS